MKILNAALAVLVSGVALAEPADGGLPVSANVKGRENTEWSQAYAFHLTDGQKDLPRVFIVGDSISGLYQDFVQKGLAGRVNVSYWRNKNEVRNA